LWLCGLRMGGLVIGRVGLRIGLLLSLGRGRVWSMVFRRAVKDCEGMHLSAALQWR
jgi:hypothetical protein